MTSRRILFISRKYPPMKGGMESYSYNLISNYEGDFEYIVLRKKQIHLLWFYPYCLLFVLFNGRKFDVIQLGDMLLCGIGWLAKKINPSIKVVATVHGLDITYANPLYRFYLNRFSYGFDSYVPNSTYTKNIAEEYGYHPCTVIPPATLGNDIPKSILSRNDFCKKYGLPENSFIVSTVGRLVKRKGVDWFIRNVLTNLENTNLIYLVIGSGEMENTIRKSVNELHDNRVKLLGNVSDQELVDVYAHSDVFLMPNIYVENDVEGYGMVAVEAAAAGCLVIAAKIQGILDAVKDGISGILYEAGAAKDLTKLMNDVIENYDKYSAITISAVDYVKSECTGKAIAEKYKKLMQGI